MSEKPFGGHPMEDPKGHLEQAFIDEYLRLHGHEPKEVRLLPPEESKALLEAASMYAAGKLAEFEARAHYVHDIHAKD
jgi:hypothetical protein